MTGSVDGNQKLYLRLLRDEQRLARQILDLTVELVMLTSRSLGPTETLEERQTRVNGLRLRRDELETEHRRLAREVWGLNRGRSDK
jgi:hypothetical protein